MVNWTKWNLKFGKLAYYNTKNTVINRYEPIPNSVVLWPRPSSRKEKRERRNIASSNWSYILRYSYLSNQQPALTCIICHILVKVSHYLLHCPKHAASRLLINNPTSLSHILNNDPNTLPRILTFLKQTGVLRKI